LSKREPRSLANWDLPYHDYHHADEDSTDRSYRVGENNIGQGRDQKKLFVSKCTLIYCTEDTTIHFNNANNVAVTILANTWYTFYFNVYSLTHAAITEGKDLYVYTEGVLPEETGVAEA